MEIKFTRTRNVKLPNRGHSTDAGIDFFVPKFDKEFVKDFKEKNLILYKKTEINNSSTLIIGSASDEAKWEINIHDENNSLIKYNEEEGKSYVPILPNQRINIPSGIYVKMADNNRALIAFNKSGIASKFGLVTGACVIDAGYQGEIHLNLINTSNKVVRIYEDMKIVQFIELPIYISNIIEINNLNKLYQEKTSRGDGGFSSTGI